MKENALLTLALFYAIKNSFVFYYEYWEMVRWGV